MGSIVHLLRGMHVLVPRNMTQAAGFYNTLIRSDDPGLIVEVLNGYRLKERLPENLGDYTIPLGVPEIVREGEHVTLVTYGPLVRMAQEAADTLAEEAKIEIEIIDVRSLLPFDLPGLIGQSIQKTNRVLFLDEDVPGGASAYMMQQVLEGQGGFWHLDSQPRTLTSQPHRPAYGSDGNYFSKPGVDDIVEAVYDMMNEFNPVVYPGV
jgi:pyruvate/2-oxoglutarate/acetoin dehydrogenase E1 component